MIRTIVLGETVGFRVSLSAQEYLIWALWVELNPERRLPGTRAVFGPAHLVKRRVTAAICLIVCLSDLFKVGSWSNLVVVKSGRSQTEAVFAQIGLTERSAYGNGAANCCLHTCLCARANVSRCTSECVGMSEQLVRVCTCCFLSVCLSFLKAPRVQNMPIFFGLNLVSADPISTGTDRISCPGNANDSVLD